MSPGIWMSVKTTPDLGMPFKDGASPEASRGKLFS
jgi:hypothetical protein